MLRLSKPFWTIPRVRPESSSSSKLAPWTSSSRAGSIAERMSFKSHQPEPEAAVISPKLSPVTSEQQQPHHEHVVDEESDSDESIDIITQADYNDYTQFAELPLKKRKKLEAAAAAAAAAAAQDPSGKRPSAMKRFLMPHKAADDKKKMHESGPTLEELAGVPDTDIPQRNSKKRPKDQDSIEQKQQQMSNKMAKSNSQEPSEWRKAIIKSLHLGKITKKSKNSSPNSPMEPTTPQTEQENPHKVLQQEPQQDNAGHLEHQIVRIKRSDSVNSTRSRSLDTSSHPALLATTVPPMGTRRETLEMAIHKRRRSSAVRSSAITPVMGGLRPPGRLEDEAASMHVTHTFTSFTLELADVQHAQAVVNNSAVPGLFDFKRQPRLTMSSMHTDQEFKGFDSDGDAMSGYTGDADVSMEEISLHPRTPIGSKFVDKGKLRESGPSDYMLRRRVSSGDIDSDTLPELPSLAIRRELGRNGSSSRGHMKSQSLDISGRDSPRTLRRMGSATPTLNRKPSRNLLSGGPITVNVSPATTMTSSMSSRHLASQPSLEEISHWKARGGSQYNRPTLPALNTKGLPANRGRELSSSSTLVPSLNTPCSATFTTLTRSPGHYSSLGSAKNGLDAFHQYHHQRQPSSAHLQQSSGDTLLPHHLKNFSTGSTLSASTVYSTHTLNGHGQAYSPTTYQAKEFDPNRDFDPDSPVDLKAMDFETLLKTAEREQLRGREERTLKKKKSFQFGDSKPFKFQPINPSDRQNVENFANGFYKSLGPLSNNNNNHNNNNNNNNNNGKSALSALMESTPNRDEVRGRGSDASFLSTSSLGQYLNSSNLNFQLNKGKPGGFQQPQTGRPEAQRPTSSLGHYRTPITKGGLTFELSESAIMSSTGGSRGHTRSRRVMKKKTSVIKLTGKVQGRREDDGMIRVTVAPDSHQWAA
ncbi:hypothetical protein BGX31_001754 [Mortierella sp. GBA43]|nr:hypothetical protein BGX31_001754 [Mortierella sp. GBA43]